MTKPIIGITLDNEEPGHYSKFPWYAVRQNYLHSVEQLGAIPFPLFLSAHSAKDIFSLIDGLVITGGNFDIDPQMYGKDEDGSRIIKNNRTIFETTICQMCLDTNKPILGICGGEQLLNVVCSGTLIQDIASSNVNSLKHEQLNPRNQTSHSVNIKQKTKLYNIVKKQKIQVNSAHHQAIDKLGNKLIISGYADDGIIEAIEHSQHDWCVGVQWHPEFLITPEDNLLMKDFVNNASHNK
jgi:putative glutamine amidotransferase